MGRELRGAVDALSGFCEVGLGGLVDAGDEFLWVAIDEWKPGGLDLHHDAMALQEDVIAIAQRNLPFCGFVGFQRSGMFETLQVAAAENFHGDGELVAIEGLRVLARLRAVIGGPGIFLGVFGENVDEFYDEVAVGAGGRGEKIRGDLTGDGDVVIERRSFESENVRTILDEALIGHFPAAPIAFGIGG